MEAPGCSIHLKSAPARAGTPSGVALRRCIRSILGSPGFEQELEALDIPPEKLVNPLISFLCETDDLPRWRAVRAIGLTVARMARESLESARTIMRRLIWSLNDESGGIGWGAPEAMGEIMADEERLADEYRRILFSYIDESGNPLEHDLLERGVLWGIGRLARERPGLVREAAPAVLNQLRSVDPAKRALALWAIGFFEVEPRAARPLIAPLAGDPFEIPIYQDGELKIRRTSDLAAAALARLDAQEGRGESQM